MKDHKYTLSADLLVAIDVFADKVGEARRKDLDSVRDMKDMRRAIDQVRIIAAITKQDQRVRLPNGKILVVPAPKCKGGHKRPVTVH